MSEREEHDAEVAGDEPAGETVETEAEGRREPDGSERVVRRGGAVVLALIALTLGWYLLADRYTPATGQARVEAFVIGVAPEVSGTVSRVWVDNNEEVRAGQRLFELNPLQYRIAVDKARSDLERARREVGAGSAAVAAAQANLAAARANARKAQQTAERLERLYAEDPGTISVRRLEAARAELRKAEAGVDAAQADVARAIEQMGGDDEAENAILRAARAALAKAELDLERTVVRADAAGVVTDLTTDVGQPAAAGQPVLTLVAIHDVWINAEFSENNLGHLAPGTAVEIAFDVLPGEVFQGTVRSIGLGVSTGRDQPPGTLPTIDNDRDWLRQAQRFPVTIDFDPSQDPLLQDKLRVGGQATVIAYAEGTGLLRLLGKLYIRCASWLSYAY